MKTPATPSLHDKIINLPCDAGAFAAGKHDPENQAYCVGHSRALSAAAALASEADGTMCELYALAESWKLQNGDYPESKQHCANELLAILARATGTDTGKGA